MSHKRSFVFTLNMFDKLSMFIVPLDEAKYLRDAISNDVFRMNSRLSHFTDVSIGRIPGGDRKCDFDA